MNSLRSSYSERSGLWIVWWLVSLAAATFAAAPPNDTFAARHTLSGTPWGDFSASGYTSEAGAQGEVDEKMEPSPATHASVWYEWTAPSSGAWQVIADFALGAESGLAAYFMPAGGTQMSQMEPAGACLTPVDQDPSIALAVQSGQRVIFRVWTVKTVSVPGRSFSLALTPLTRRWPGDSPMDSGLVHNGNDHTGGISLDYTSSMRVSLSELSTSPEDTRLEAGKWRPASTAGWWRWVAPSGPPKQWHVGLLPNAPADTHCEVLRIHPAQPGRYQSLAPPGTDLQFTPVPGETLYIRVSTTLPFHTLHFSDGVAFLLYVSPGGDERATTPLTLSPGTTLWTGLYGATPSALPLPVETWSTLNMADIWVRLTGLIPLERYAVYGDSFNWLCNYQLYEESPDGTLISPAAGNGGAFTVLPDREYYLRVTVYAPYVDESGDYITSLNLYPSSRPPPANDDWTGAFVVSAATASPLVGDLRGATTSAAEAYVFTGTPPVAVIRPRTRTVWYALDLPASADSFGVSALGRTVTLFKLDGEGRLMELSAGPSTTLPVYLPDGSRVLAMVSGIEDRFLFMVTPVTREGDSQLNPLPLATGEVSRYFPCWATAEPDENLEEWEGTSWHRWTAPASGRYHLSQLGSAFNYYEYAIYAGPAPLTGEPLPTEYFAGSYEGAGQVYSFDAQAGAEYWIRTTARHQEGGPALLYVAPAAGASPYTYWRQSMPAWDDILADPQADPDGDGASNLLEMAVGNHPGKRNSLPYGVRSLNSPQPSGIEIFVHTHASTKLRGPPGCIPFVLSAEKSADLVSWESLGPLQAMKANILEGEQFKYLRLRISR